MGSPAGCQDSDFKSEGRTHHCVEVLIQLNIARPTPPFMLLGLHVFWLVLKITT